MKKYRVDEDGDIIMTTNGCDCYINIEDLENHLNGMATETEKCYSEIKDRDKIIQGKIEEYYRQEKRIIELETHLAEVFCYTNDGNTEKVKEISKPFTFGQIKNH